MPEEIKQIKIKPVRAKRTYTAGKVPAIGDLVEGELFINHADKKTWVRNGDDEIVLVSYLPENNEVLDKLSEKDNKPSYDGKEIALITPTTPSGWDNGSPYDPTVVWKEHDIVFNTKDSKSYIRIKDAVVAEPVFLDTNWKVTTPITRYVEFIRGSAYGLKLVGYSIVTYLDVKTSPERTDDNIINIFNGLSKPQFNSWENSAVSFRAVKVWVESLLKKGVEEQPFNTTNQLGKVYDGSLKEKKLITEANGWSYSKNFVAKFGSYNVVKSTRLDSNKVFKVAFPTPISAIGNYKLSYEFYINPLGNPSPTMQCYSLASFYDVLGEDINYIRGAALYNTTTIATANAPVGSMVIQVDNNKFRKTGVLAGKRIKLPMVYDDIDYNGYAFSDVFSHASKTDAIDFDNSTSTTIKLKEPLEVAIKAGDMLNQAWASGSFIYLKTKYYVRDTGHVIVEESGSDFHIESKYYEKVIVAEFEVSGIGTWRQGRAPFGSAGMAANALLGTNRNNDDCEIYASNFKIVEI